MAPECPNFPGTWSEKGPFGTPRFTVCKCGRCVTNWPSPTVTIGQMIEAATGGNQVVIGRVAGVVPGHFLMVEEDNERHTPRTLLMDRFVWRNYDPSRPYIPPVETRFDREDVV